MSAALLFAVPALTLLEPSVVDSLLGDTQGNEAFWREYLASVDGLALESADYLLSEMPRLDRLEMTEAILSDHIFGAIETRSVYYDTLPDSVFFPGLVEYRVSEEPVTAFRAPLYAHWHAVLCNPDSTAAEVAREIAGSIGRFRVRRPTFLGGVAGPLDVLAAGSGTTDELRVLFGASLRSMGIAARSVTGYFAHVGQSGWMEIWDGSRWLPMPLASDSIPDDWEGLAFAVAGNEERTAALAPVGTLILEPARMVPESAGAAISVAARGMWVPIDYLEFSPTEDCTLTLGEGEYLLQLTRRRPSGAVDLWTDLVDILRGASVTVSLDQLSAGAR